MSEGISPGTFSSSLSGVIIGGRKSISQTSEESRQKHNYNTRLKGVEAELGSSKGEKEKAAAAGTCGKTLSPSFPPTISEPPERLGKSGREGGKKATDRASRHQLSLNEH